MCKGILIIFIFSCLTACSHSVTLSSYLTAADLERFRNIFLQPYNDDLKELEYTIAALTQLGVPLPEPNKICDTVKKNVDIDNVESLFRVIYAVSNLKTNGIACDVSLGSVESKLNSVLTSDSSTTHILHAVSGLSLLGHKIDAAAVSKAVYAALKADDTPLSYAYGFYAALFLPVDEMKKFHEMIEDIVAQADEIDDSYLQFDGGVVPTSAVLYAAYKLSEAVNLAPTISEDKVVKFTNYLMSRKHTQSRKEAAHLISAIKMLSMNKFHVPVTVSLASSVSVSTKSPVVQVRVCSLMGSSLGKLSVVADTARHVGDDAVILSKKTLPVSTADDSLYDLDLMKVNPKRGFYHIVLNVGAAGQASAYKLVGSAGAEVEVKVITHVIVDSVELSVADKDQSSVPKANKLQYPNKLTVEADHHQILMLRFSVREETSKEPITAHQTFVRLTNLKTKQELIFVAEEESGGFVYKFDLDIGAKSKDFRNLSGKYTMDLIIGDAVIENPISWTVAEVQLTFQDDPLSTTDSQLLYAKKPEIVHMFREPEKRPPAVVSNFFTGLVLLPVLILFVLWLKLGANMSNFPFSLSALGFHAGLAAIFALYLCYFLHLTMFQTLRYLGLIGIPTFLFGHRLLSGIAARGSKSKGR